MRATELELYIHIPFCIRKCAYCDFCSYVKDAKTHRRYVDWLKLELAMLGKAHGGRKVRSVFYGGGTPSILEEGAIAQLQQCVREHFCLKEDCEITIECNPGTLTEAKLREYRACGITRISLGLQSADDAELGVIGRIHTAAQAKESIALVKQCGFSNFNLDVMMGLPGQTLQSLEKTLAFCVESEATHLSVYDLILEEGTPLAAYHRAHPEQFPEEELTCSMYLFADEFLRGHGFEHYEVSNYARPGFACRHNLGYWQDVDYLGAGVAASSYCHPVRRTNTTSLDEYFSVDFSKIPPTAYFEEETVLTRAEQAHEFFFLSMRMFRGISEADFRERFPELSFAPYEQLLRDYVAKGLLRYEQERYFFSPEGMLLSNQLFAALLEI